MKRNMLQLLGDGFIYDGTDGEFYSVGKELVKAVNNIHQLNWDIDVDSNNQNDPKAIAAVKSLISKGVFTNSPISEQLFPNQNDIKSVSLGEMSLVVTDACNLRCTYCPHSTQTNNEFYRKHGKNSVCDEVLELAADYFSANCEDGSILGFFGGEPLLNFSAIRNTIIKVRRLVNYKKDIAFTVTSNLSYISTEMIDFLAENNVLLLVSIDGPKNVHDRYRRHKNGKGTYQDVKSNLDLIKSRNINYYSRYVSINCILNQKSPSIIISNFPYHSTIIFNKRNVFISL